MNKYFAICPRGLEELLLEELRGVGGEELRSTSGGVFFSGDWPVCYRANLESACLFCLDAILGLAPECRAVAA